MVWRVDFLAGFGGVLSIYEGVLPAGGSDDVFLYIGVLSYIGVRLWGCVLCGASSCVCLCVCLCLVI